MHGIRTHAGSKSNGAELVLLVRFHASEAKLSFAFSAASEGLLGGNVGRGNTLVTVPSGANGAAVTRSGLGLAVGAANGLTSGHAGLAAATDLVPLGGGEHVTVLLVALGLAVLGLAVHGGLVVLIRLALGNTLVAVDLVTDDVRRCGRLDGTYEMLGQTHWSPF